MLTSMDDTVFTEEQVHPDSAIIKDVDFLISYRYRYILPGELLKKFTGKAINLHISFLPWNRGADPNLWSFLENTPKGVTIHYINSGIDTGDIIAQKKLEFNEKDTLRSTYERLSDEVISLFKDVWLDIRNGKVKHFPQPARGSFHKTADKEKYLYLLSKGWDTPVSDIISKALGKN